MTKKLLILGTLAVATFSMPQAMMKWGDGQREERQATIHGAEAPDISTLEKMWSLANGAKESNDADRLKHIAIMALENPDAVSEKPDGTFGVDVKKALLGNGSDVTLSFNFKEKENEEIQFSTDFSPLEVRAGKKLKTLEALWAFLSEKNKEALSGLHGVLCGLDAGKHYGDGTFSVEVRDTRTLGENEKGYPVKVILRFRFNKKQDKELPYTHVVESQFSQEAEDSDVEGGNSDDERADS